MINKAISDYERDQTLCPFMFLGVSSNSTKNSVQNYLFVNLREQSVQGTSHLIENSTTFLQDLSISNLSNDTKVGLMTNDERLMKKAFIKGMEGRVLCSLLEEGMKD